MKKNIILISSILLITIFNFGCSRTKATVKYIPELKKTSTVEVGKNMYEKIFAIFDKNKYVVLLDSEDNYRYNVPLTGKAFAPLNDVKCVMHNKGDSLFDYNCDNTFTHISALFKDPTKLDKPIAYKILPPRYKTIRTSFKYNVLYRGKIDNKLNITFQEFSLFNNNFIIRDAYTQNIQYELDKNGEAMIGFKGLRIKVLKATNLNITYQVLKDYD